MTGSNGSNERRPEDRSGGLPRGSKQYFNSYHSVLKMLPYQQIDRVVDLLTQARQEGRTVFVFGNGGSAALASHFACDLGKGTPRDNQTKLFRVVSLADNVSLITAWANDRSYEDVFLEQMRNLIVPGDVAFAISGSGNSPNVLRALEYGKAVGATTVGLTGFSGGKVKSWCDLCVIVPAENMQVIEDFHLRVCHAIFLGVGQRILSGCRLAAAAAQND